MRHRRGLLAVLALVVACSPAGQEAGTAPETSRPPSPSASAPSEPAPDPAPRQATVALAGDVLLHDGLWATAKADGDGGMDFGPMLAGVQQVISEADLAVCHLEMPLAPPDGPYSAYPLFSAPPQIVPALRDIGFDACTTASNHSVDQGFDGLRRTLDVLDRHGIDHAGTARTRRESRRPVLLDADGVRVALVSQTYGTNGMPVEKPWSVQLLDPTAVERRAAAARMAGAEIVLVALHWGAEYQHEPTDRQRSIARTLLRSSDIDLVYGHHTHVVQPFERIGDKWVAYGLGNMLAEQETPVTGNYEGVTARFTFVERTNGRFRVRRAEYVPTYITEYDPAEPDMRLLRITEALPDGTLQATPDELRAALQRIRHDVKLLGARPTLDPAG